MAADSGDVPNLTGIKKYFNSYTIKGRRNVALAVYGCGFMGFLYFKLKPSKPKPQ